MNKRNEWVGVTSINETIKSEIGGNLAWHLKLLRIGFFDRQVSFKNHGKHTYMGVEAKYNLERAKKILHTII